MPTITLSDPANGTSADATLIANNNAALKTLLNGGIDNSNVAAGAAIAGSKLALNNTIVQPTHFAGGSKRTTSTYAGGPPGAPSEGDIWIATGVNLGSVGGVGRWQFSYNAAGGYWAFIGGPQLLFSSPSTSANNGSTLNTYINVVGSTLTLARTGSYYISASAQTGNSGGGDALLTTALYLNTVANVFAGAVINHLHSGWSMPITIPKILISPTAGAVIGVSGNSNGASCSWSNVTLMIEPIFVT